MSVKVAVNCGTFDTRSQPALTGTAGETQHFVCRENLNMKKGYLNYRDGKIVKTSGV